MKQRVGLARALATDPDVLLMDEPFAALDAQTRDLMQVELLRIWQEARKTVLFVTHQIDEAIYLSDRVMVMTKRPGRAKRIFAIDLPRPRDYEMRVTPRVQRAQARNLERAQGRDHGVADDGRRRPVARRASPTPPQGAARPACGRDVLRRLAGGVPGRAVQSAVHHQADLICDGLRRSDRKRRSVSRSRRQRRAVLLRLPRRGGRRRPARHRHGLAAAGRLCARSADDGVLREPAGRAGAAGDRVLRRRRLRQGDHHLLALGVSVHLQRPGRRARGRSAADQRGALDGRRRAGPLSQGDRAERAALYRRRRPHRRRPRR